jgi:hypothetical protein
MSEAAAARLELVPEEEPGAGAPAAGDAAAEGDTAGPGLGVIVVGTIDHTRVIRWTLGTQAIAHGLTVRGMAAAAVASGRYLAGLKPQAVTGSPVLRITPHEWALPLVPNDAAAVEAMMTEVVNAQGAIGALG